MKALVVFFTVFIICLFGWFGGAIRKRTKAEPGLRLVRANGLLVRQNKHSGGDEDA